MTNETQATARFMEQQGRGRLADGPTEIPPPGWKDILYRVYRGIGRDRILLTAAGVTFYVLLVLVPTLTAFVAIYGLFTSPGGAVAHVALLEGIVPPDGLDIIREQLVRLTVESGQALGLTLLISLSIALWSASAGVKAMFEAMNIAYHEDEKRSFFALNALALVFTLGGAVAAVFVVTVVVVIPSVIDLFVRDGGQEWLVRVASYLVMLFVVLFGLGALYRWGPSRARARWRWVTPGALLAVATLGAASVAFSWYVANFGDYNATYGSLGALIGFLTWVWISVIAVICGAALNSEIEHQTARDSTVGPDRPLGARGAHMADTIGRVWPPEREALETLPPTVRSKQPVPWGVLTIGVAVLLLLSRPQGRTPDRR